MNCFYSIFAGLSTLLNFGFMITWILSGIVISSEWPYIPMLHWNFSRNTDVIYENILNVKSTFDHYIVVFIEKYNLFLIIILGFISVVSMFAVLCWPRLQVPDSSEFQLFEKKHPFEQYDMIYKDRFRFSHAYSVSVLQHFFYLCYIKMNTNCREVTLCSVLPSGHLLLYLLHLELYCSGWGL